MDPQERRSADPRLGEDRRPLGRQANHRPGRSRPQLPWRASIGGIHSIVRSIRFQSGHSSGHFRGGRPVTIRNATFVGGLSRWLLTMFLVVVPAGPTLAEAITDTLGVEEVLRRENAELDS